MLWTCNLSFAISLRHPSSLPNLQLHDFTGRTGNTTVKFTVEHRSAYTLSFTADVACALYQLTNLAPPPPRSPPPPPQAPGRMVFDDEFAPPPPLRTTPLVTLGARTLALHYLPRLGVDPGAARRAVLLAPPTVTLINTAATGGAPVEGDGSGLQCLMNVKLGVEVGGGEEGAGGACWSP